jgi:branched-subunit amino acid aminotransferase/4-amino-4-deoxychorismate lyase
VVGGVDRATLQALLDRPGCYTTARVRAGAPTLPARHADRLLRDARALGLPPPDPAVIAEAFAVLARLAFGPGEGIVRLQVGAHDDGHPALVGTTRPLGDDRATWRATVAPFAHPGPARAPGAKLATRPVWRRARAWAADHETDETLLFDAEDRLVEGARSNLVVVDGQGGLLHPEPGLGAVAGLALAVVTEREPALRPARIGRARLADARELLALNAVRGVRPITSIDGCLVGEGRPGPVAARLAAVFAAAIQEESRADR